LEAYEERPIPRHHPGNGNNSKNELNNKEYRNKDHNHENDDFREIIQHKSTEDQEQITE